VEADVAGPLVQPFLAGVRSRFPPSSGKDVTGVRNRIASSNLAREPDRSVAAGLVVAGTIALWAHFGPVGRYLGGDRLVDWWMSREIPHR
jgi:hypothetical protein